MVFTKKIDRAFQWAGERMGQEAKTTMSEDFKALETEMALRQDGMQRLQSSMNAYVKWLSHRDGFGDREKGMPTANLGRTMIGHGEDFDPSSEFGNCLISMGRANDRVAVIQEQYSNDATSYWLNSVERSVATMKEFQAARKKLESRRLALDASTAKVSKAKKDDFRLEEELRSAKAKYEEAEDDVYRRMQDIKDAEADSIRDLTRFLDIELDFHERCAEELRRTRQDWVGSSSPTATYSSRDRERERDRDRDFGGNNGLSVRRPSARSRSNTTHSYGGRSQNGAQEEYDEYDEPDYVPAQAQHQQQPARVPIRSQSRVSMHSAASAAHDHPAPRPGVSRASTYQSERSLNTNVGASLSRTTSAASTPLSAMASQPQNNISSLRGQLRPTGRATGMDVFADDDSGGSDTPDRSSSPATSYGSSNRGMINNGNMASVAGKKAPPPPPSRAKKPPPPVPVRREVGY